MKLLRWIFLSSEDASRISATIKGIAAFIPSAVIFFGFLHINVDSSLLFDIVDKLVLTVTAITGAVSAIVATVGAIRKVVTTIRGTNNVVNTQF